MFLAPLWSCLTGAGIPRGSFISCELSCFIGPRSFLTRPIFVRQPKLSRHARSWSPPLPIETLPIGMLGKHYSHRLSATIQTCQRLQLPTKTTRASPNSSVYVQTYNYDRKVVLIVDPINLWGYFYRLFVHRVIHFASFVHIVSYSRNFDEFTWRSSVTFQLIFNNCGYLNYVFTSKNCWQLIVRIIQTIIQRFD